ncbi:hypothetical protein D3C73_616980 [compost metagenome]
MNALVVSWLNQHVPCIILNNVSVRGITLLIMSYGDHLQKRSLHINITWNASLCPEGPSWRITSLYIIGFHSVVQLQIGFLWKPPHLNYGLFCHLESEIDAIIFI